MVLVVIVGVNFGCGDGGVGGRGSGAASSGLIKAARPSGRAFARHKCSRRAR